jgi:hypothetical protein
MADHQYVVRKTDQITKTNQTKRDNKENFYCFL